MKHLRPAELQALLAEPGRARPYLLDVREPWEYNVCHIEGAVLMPMQTITGRLAELDRNQEIVVICHHGVRSHHVARFLEQSGFTNIINLSGGVDGWAKEADPTMPTY